MPVDEMFVSKECSVNPHQYLVVHPTYKVISLVLSGISRLNPLTTGVITYLRFVGSSPPSKIQ